MFIESGRVLRKTYPAMMVLSREVHSEGRIEQGLGTLRPNVDGVMCGGGCPYQGRSQLSRANQETSYSTRSSGSSSSLMSRSLRRTSRLKFAENVAAGINHIEEMSHALRMRPMLVESGDGSRVRRPSFEWKVHELFDKLSITGVENSTIGEFAPPAL